MSENWRVQISMKLGGTMQHMVNLRGDTVDEVVALVEALNDHAVNVGQQADAITGAFNVGAAFPRAQQVPDTPPARPANVAPAPAAPGPSQGQGFVPNRFQQSPPPGPAPIDRNGKAMIWKDFQSKAGKRVKGWFPDYAQGDPAGQGIDPQWVR